MDGCSGDQKNGLVQISIKLSPILLDVIKDSAKEQNISVAHYIRNSLTSFIKNKLREETKKVLEVL